MTFIAQHWSETTTVSADLTGFHNELSQRMRVDKYISSNIYISTELWEIDSCKI